MCRPDKADNQVNFSTELNSCAGKTPGPTGSSLTFLLHSSWATQSLLVSQMMHHNSRCKIWNPQAIPEESWYGAWIGIPNVFHPHAFRSFFCWLSWIAMLTWNGSVNGCTKNKKNILNTLDLSNIHFFLSTHYPTPTHHHPDIWLTGWVICCGPGVDRGPAGFGADKGMIMCPCCFPFLSSTCLAHLKAEAGSFYPKANSNGYLQPD